MNLKELAKQIHADNKVVGWRDGGYMSEAAEFLMMFAIGASLSFAITAISMWTARGEEFARWAFAGSVVAALQSFIFVFVA